MGNKKRKSSSVEAVLSPKRTRLSEKLKLKREEQFRASLPILSDEKLYHDDVKPYIGNIVEDKVLKVVIPKIKIRCEPLNVEKVIDLRSNENSWYISKSTETSRGRKSKNTNLAKTKSSKCTTLKKKVKKMKESSSKPLPVRNLKISMIKELKQDKLADSSVVHSMKAESNTVKPKKLKILINGSLPNQNKPCLSNCSHTQKKISEQSLKASKPEAIEKQSSANLNVDISNKEASYLSFCSLDDETALMELKDVNLEELEPSLECASDEELEMKLKEGAVEGNKNNQEVIGSSDLLEINEITSVNPTNSSNKNDEDQGRLNKNTLQNLVETFMKNPQLNYLKENTALKKGLCFTWLSNNYMCSSEQCTYSHNALSLFIKKLKQYPSKFIMVVVTSMRNDILFVDVIMAAFKILSERKVPVLWVTFLIYFVFYVTEPSDSRFFKFWVNSARFFCQLDRNYAAANGFASLLSIFSQGEKSEEWKIIEFIKLIKLPPVQMSASYALLQPVLNMNIPSQLLTEAIESSITTKENLLKVYSIIIPKISLITSPIQVVELLLKFCQTLEEEGFNIYAHDLRSRLRPKVSSFKTKVIQREYPLTAIFQEELSRDSLEDSLLPALEIQTEETKTNPSNAEVNNYFEIQEDFYNLMTETLKLSPDSIPSPYRNEISLDKTIGTQSKEDDVCERQIMRIKQFFRDRQFDLLGKYLNELRPNAIERGTQVILKLLLYMKISLQQVVDVVKIILLHCKTENASKIIANLSITLILNLVRINQWKKAHTITTLCAEKDIHLITGKVFYLNELNNVTQCRIVLLLIEIYAYKRDYASAIRLIKEHSLFTSDNTLWKGTWKPHDETIRIRIMEDLLHQIIFSQNTKLAFDLFETIWKAQNGLFGSVDLRKFVNEILILLLNQDAQDAVNLYEIIKTEVELSDTTARAILVTLVRQNQLSAAKSLMQSTKQNIYSLPGIQLNSIEVNISSIWLEEEIFVMFDAFFDSLIKKKQNFVMTDFSNLRIYIQILKPNKIPCSSVRPLCLGIIKPFFKDALNRIQRVLQYQFNPPLKLIFKPSGLSLEVLSLKRHLEKRMNLNSC